MSVTFRLLLALFNDTGSVKVFEKQHARDVVASDARHLDDGAEPGTIVGAHASSEERQGIGVIALGVLTSVLAMALLLLI